ncbi:MAG: hypothetical protein ACOCZQ_03430 [Nanoarchaeota archaeon]
MKSFKLEYLGIELPLRDNEEMKYQRDSKVGAFIKHNLAILPLYSTEMKVSGNKKEVKINVFPSKVFEKYTGYKGDDLEVFHTAYMGSAEALAMIYTGHTMALYEEVNRISGNRLNSFMGSAHSADEIFQRALENNNSLDSQVREMLERDAKVGSLLALKKNNYNMAQILSFLGREAKQGRISPEYAYKVI